MINLDLYRLPIAGNSMSSLPALTLAKARNVKAEETSIAEALSNVSKPVFIFASNTDNVSPYSFWKKTSKVSL